MRRKLCISIMAMQHSSTARWPFKYVFVSNLIPVQAHCNFSGGSLADDMKLFGVAHRDKRDAVTGMSCMLVNSDLPDEEGEEPGRFHFLAWGFWVRLDLWLTVYFSGQLPHGGTAPITALGKTAQHWACRSVLIGYPPRMIMEGDVRHSLAALPHSDQPLYITPEMTGIKYVRQSVSIS